jgi:hypothetical protein
MTPSIMFTLERENDLSGPEKPFRFRLAEVIIKEGIKSSKNRSEGSDSVQNNRLIIKEGCSQLEVLLYFY